MPPKELHAIRLETETVQAVDRIAKAEGRTRADVIRRLIMGALSSEVARVLFDRLEAMAWDEVAAGDESYFNTESGESGPEVIARFLASARTHINKEA